MCWLYGLCVHFACFEFTLFSAYFRDVFFLFDVCLTFTFVVFFLCLFDNFVALAPFTFVIVSNNPYLTLTLSSQAIFQFFLRF